MTQRSEPTGGAPVRIIIEPSDPEAEALLAAEVEELLRAGVLEEVAPERSFRRDNLNGTPQ